MPAAGLGSRPGRGGAEEQCGCNGKGQNDRAGARSRDGRPGIGNDGVDAMLGVRSSEASRSGDELNQVTPIVRRDTAVARGGYQYATGFGTQRHYIHIGWSARGTK